MMVPLELPSVPKPFIASLFSLAVESEHGSQYVAETECQSGPRLE